MRPMTLAEGSSGKVEMTERVRELRKVYFRAVPEICIERARLVTEYSLKNGYFAKERLSILDKAKLYRYVLENRQAVVHHSRGYERDEMGLKLFKFTDTQLFAGSTTSKFKGVPLYPEFMALALWPELWTLPKRKSNPYQITEKEIEKLNWDIFPHWIDHTLLEHARKRHCDEPEFREAMKLFTQIVFFLTGKVENISHTIPDFSVALGKGLKEIIKEAQSKKAETPDRPKREFYEAIAEVLEGVIAYSKNLADEAEKLAKKETDPVRKQELIDIAKIHRWVPEHEARTFREGLTTLWICWTAIHLENPNLALSLGRLDQVLYELYRQDDSIDDQSAIELLCLLWLKIGDHVPMIPEAGEQLFGGAGSNQAITIGGVNKEEKDAVNELTYLILRSIELMGLRDPNLNARYFPGENEKAYLRRLCEANINTGATPALHNDRAVVNALVAKGDTEAEARDYGIVGCVEPTSSGRTYGSCGSILFNLTSVLELVLFQGRHRLIGLDKDPLNTETGDPAAFNTFGEFKKAFEKQTRWLADKAVYLNDKLGKVHQDFYPTPILSAFFEQDGGPFGRGMDLTRGGAKINSSGVAVIGLADVADSLSAIQEIVYGKKDPEETRVAFGELLDALERDFEGNEPLRTRIREKAPKYGHGNSVADDNLKYILELLDMVFSQKTTYRGGKYRVGYWTLTNHAGLGKIMGATPNGRKKGANFASGVTPVSGFSPELTKALISAAKLPAKFLSNGIALNLRFTPNNEDHNRMADNLVEYLVPYFDNGGMEIQFNIRSREDFLKAREEPDKYPELLVRVSGYTAYFKDLSRQMQDEIIERTEYRLSTGKEVDSLIPLPKLPLKTEEKDRGNS